MPEQVLMPRLSDTMTEGTVSKWLKHQGDDVKKGEPIVEIETDKANIELEAYASGKLARIVLQEGQSAPVGEVIGEIALPGEGAARAAPAPEAAPAAPSPSPRPATPEAMPVPSPRPPTPEEPEPEGHLRASPIARRLARELGVDLTRVKGTGPLGRIQKEDVEAAAQAKSAAGPRPPAPAEATPAGPDTEVVALSRMQQTIARRMVEAKGPVPHFYVSMDVAMDKAVADLEELNEGVAKEQVVTINDLILRACAVTLREFPDVNSSYQDGKLLRHKGVHVGFAVAVQGGLIEPVVRDADRKSLRDLASETKALAAKMRDGKAEPGDYEGGTFSISNLGMYGVSEFSAIINPPHSAILAVGAVQDKPVVVDGHLTIGKRCTITLSADHRVFYGATAAEFVRAVKHKLEKPLQLFT